MTDEINKRLERHGAADTPRANDDFADRLESNLRYQHAGLTTAGRRPRIALLPRLGVALLLVVVALAGAATLLSRDGGVPIEVVEGEPAAPADAPETGDEKPTEPAPIASATPTTTPTAAPTPDPTSDPEETVVTPVPTAPPVDVAPEPSTAAPQAEPTTTGAVPTPSPTSTVLTPVERPTSSPSPTVVRPTPAATATSSPRPTPLPTRPVPPLATPVPLPTSTPTPEPTATATPIPINLACESRQVGDALGVRCTWDIIATDQIASFEVLRSRNGSDRAVVATQRATLPWVFVDRKVEPGDQVIYLVRALSADKRVVGASERQIVQIPGGG